jgi:hypothetical protein
VVMEAARLTANFSAESCHASYVAAQKVCLARVVQGCRVKFNPQE